MSNYIRFAYQYLNSAFRLDLGLLGNKFEVGLAEMTSETILNNLSYTLKYKKQLDTEFITLFSDVPVELFGNSIRNVDNFDIDDFDNYTNYQFKLIISGDENNILVYDDDEEGGNPVYRPVEGNKLIFFNYQVESSLFYSKKDLFIRTFNMIDDYNIKSTDYPSFTINIPFDGGIDFDNNFGMFVYWKKDGEEWSDLNSQEMTLPMYYAFHDDEDWIYWLSPFMTCKINKLAINTHYYFKFKILKQSGSEYDIAFIDEENGTVYGKTREKEFDSEENGIVFEYKTPSVAEEVIFDAVKDTKIDPTNPTTNYGLEQSIAVSSGSNKYANNFGLLGFDFSENNIKYSKESDIRTIHLKLGSMSGAAYAPEKIAVAKIGPAFDNSDYSSFIEGTGGIELGLDPDLPATYNNTFNEKLYRLSHLKEILLSNRENSLAGNYRYKNYFDISDTYIADYIRKALTLEPSIVDKNYSDDPQNNYEWFKIQNNDNILTKPTTYWNSSNGTIETHEWAFGTCDNDFTGGVGAESSCMMTIEPQTVAPTEKPVLVYENKSNHIINKLRIRQYKHDQTGYIDPSNHLGIKKLKIYGTNYLASELLNKNISNDANIHLLIPILNEGENYTIDGNVIVLPDLGQNIIGFFDILLNNSSSYKTYIYHIEEFYMPVAGPRTNFLGRNYFVTKYNEFLEANIQPFISDLFDFAFKSNDTYTLYDIVSRENTLHEDLIAQIIINGEYGSLDNKAYLDVLPIIRNISTDNKSLDVYWLCNASHLTGFTGAKLNVNEINIDGDGAIVNAGELKAGGYTDYTIVDIADVPVNDRVPFKSNIFKEAIKFTFDISTIDGYTNETLNSKNLSLSITVDCTDGFMIYDVSKGYYNISSEDGSGFFIDDAIQSYTMSTLYLGSKAATDGSNFNVSNGLYGQRVYTPSSASKFSPYNIYYNPDVATNIMPEYDGKYFIKAYQNQRTNYSIGYTESPMKDELVAYFIFDTNGVFKFYYEKKVGEETVGTIENKSIITNISVDDISNTNGIKVIVQKSGDNNNNCSIKARWKLKNADDSTYSSLESLSQSGTTFSLSKFGFNYNTAYTWEIVCEDIDGISDNSSKSPSFEGTGIIKYLDDVTTNGIPIDIAISNASSTPSVDTCAIKANYTTQNGFTNTDVNITAQLTYGLKNQITGLMDNPKTINMIKNTTSVSEGNYYALLGDSSYTGVNSKLTPGKEYMYTILYTNQNNRKISGGTDIAPFTKTDDGTFRTDTNDVNNSPSPCTFVLPNEKDISANINITSDVDLYFEPVDTNPLGELSAVNYNLYYTRLNVDINDNPEDFTNNNATGLAALDESRWTLLTKKKHSELISTLQDVSKHGTVYQSVLHYNTGPIFANFNKCYVGFRLVVDNVSNKSNPSYSNGVFHVNWNNPPSPPNKVQFDNIDLNLNTTFDSGKAHILSFDWINGLSKPNVLKWGYRYRVDGTTNWGPELNNSYTIVNQSATSIVFIADTFSDDTIYELQIIVYDTALPDTPSTPWTGKFRTSKLTGVPIINEFTDDICAQENPLISWIPNTPVGTTQKSYELILKEDGVEVWSYNKLHNEPDSSTDNIILPYDLKDSTQYTIKLSVQNTGLNWSDYATYDFTVQLYPPDAPILELIMTDTVDGIAHFQITPPKNDSDISQYNVWRIGDDLNYNKSGLIQEKVDLYFSDYTLAYNKPYYFYVQALGINGASAYSNIVRVMITFSDANIMDMPDIEYLVRLLGEPKNRSEDIDNKNTYILTNSRKNPLIVRGINKETTIDHTYTITSQEQLESLRNINDKDVICLFRDNSQRRYFVGIDNLMISDSWWNGNKRWYSVSIPLTVVDYNEYISTKALIDIPIEDITITVEEYRG